MTARLTLDPRRYQRLDERLIASPGTQRLWEIDDDGTLTLGRIASNGAPIFFTLSPADTERLLSDLEAWKEQR